MEVDGDGAEKEEEEERGRRQQESAIEEEGEEEEEEAEWMEEGQRQIMVNGNYSGVLVNGGSDPREGTDSEAMRGTDQDEVVGDQPTVFGLTSKLKQTTLLNGHDSVQDQDEGGGDNGQTRVDKAMVEEHDENELISLRSGSVAFSSGSERKKAKGVVEMKDKHRTMKTSGLFGAEGKDLMASQSYQQLTSYSVLMIVRRNLRDAFPGSGGFGGGGWCQCATSD